MDEQKTVTQIFEEVKVEICDKYCKYPEKKDIDEYELIEKICANCPLGKL